MTLNMPHHPFQPTWKNLSSVSAFPSKGLEFQKVAADIGGEGLSFLPEIQISSTPNRTLL